MFLTQNEPDTDHVTRKIGPLYFIWSNVTSGEGIVTKKLRSIYFTIDNFEIDFMSIKYISIKLKQMIKIIN